MPQNYFRRGDTLDIPNFGRMLVRQVREGRLGSLISRVQLDDGRSFYLKQGKGEAAADLREEVQRLEWLKGRLAVPRVYRLKADLGEVKILLESVPGRPSHHATLPKAKRLEILAQALRQIHSIPIDDCPFRDTLDHELAEAERRLRRGALNLDAFVKETAGITPSLALERLHATRGIIHESVFTHGDYCLPNVMINKGSLSGVIDWGIAGIADPHRDFMAIWDSIEFNLGKIWISRFFEAYGIVKPDQDRIRYYNLLDQFFAHHQPR